MEVDDVAPKAVVASRLHAHKIMTVGIEACQQVVFDAVGHMVGHILGKVRVGGHLHIPLSLAVVKHIPTQADRVGCHFAIAQDTHGIAVEIECHFHIVNE